MKQGPNTIKQWKQALRLYVQVSMQHCEQSSPSKSQTCFMLHSCKLSIMPLSPVIKNYIIIFEQNVQQRFQQLIMNWDLKAFRRVWTESRRDFYIKRQEIFQSAFVLGSEVGSVPEIISVLIIPVRKCGKQIVPHWAQHGVNGLIAKEKQGNLLSSTC